MADLLNKTVATPAGAAPVVPVMIMGFGAYLTWFGVHYWRSETAWPSDPVKAVLTGRAIPVVDRAAGEAAIRSLVTGASGTASPAGGAPSGVSGPVMSKAQLRALWIANGGDAGKAPIAAAIALAESSGRWGITSPNPDGGTNTGLWQLDTRGEGAGYTIAQLQDPATNARVTIMKTANGTNWSKWETWHTGAYRTYL